MNLTEALNNPLWLNHKIGNTYSMINMDKSTSDGWKIAYYPLFENHRGEQYKEPRALIERPMMGGTDFREVAMRYLTIAQKV